MLGQRLRRWPNIEPTLNKCTMLERKSSAAQQTQDICMTFIQRRPNVFDVCLQASNQVGARAKSFELLTHRCRSSLYELAVIENLLLRGFGHETHI